MVKWFKPALLPHICIVAWGPCHVLWLKHLELHPHGKIPVKLERVVKAICLIWNASVYTTKRIWGGWGFTGYTAAPVTLVLGEKKKANNTRNFDPHILKTHLNHQEVPSTQVLVKNMRIPQDVRFSSASSEWSMLTDYSGVAPAEDLWVQKCQLLPEGKLI